MRLGLFIVLVLCPSVQAQPPIAFRNVTVVDVEKGALRQTQTVIIEGAKITAADNASRVRVPGAARIIDGKGKFLIPGLWDMHVHEFGSPRVPELFLANGVTGIRDMYDEPATIRELSKAIRQHRRAGPRVVHQGRTLNGVVDHGWEVIIRTPEQARQAVRQQIKEGAEFIKVYNGLPRDAYYAAADECKKNAIPFVGHTPDAVTTADAAAAGQKSIEHLDGVLLDSSWNTKELRRAKRFLPDRNLLNTFDATRANQLFATYVRHGTWHCPTLSIFRSNVLMDDPKDALKDRTLLSLPKEWMPNPARDIFRDIALDRPVQQKMMEVTAMMYRAGVPLLAGTDTGVPFVLPGYGLHEELELLVAAGLPASAVLRIATLAPAQFFGRASELGTVAPGKLADLVLLGADPLQSIANTRRVRAVVADGRLYDRAGLDRMLADAGGGK